MNPERSLPRAGIGSPRFPETAVAGFMDELEKEGLELHSFMLVRRGCVVAEHWWAPYAPELPHMLFSLSKSFTSAAVGLAAAEGRLSLQDKVVTFFPGLAPLNPPDHLQEMTVRDLMIMGTGHARDTMEALNEKPQEDWVKVFLALPVEHSPGTRFVYNSGASYMLSAIVQEVTGLPLLAYLQPRLLEPLAIRGAEWESCPMGRNFGGWGLSLRTEDIAKFGQLLLQKGMWEGKRILPEGWMKEAVIKQIENGSGADNDWSQGYGYQFWMCRNGAYRGDGAFGQFCVVMPEEEAVLAVTAGTVRMQDVLKAVWSHLLPPLRGQQPASLSEGKASKAWRLDPPKQTSRSVRESLLSDLSYRLEPNVHRLTGIRFQFRPDSAELIIQTQERGELTILLGREHWLESFASVIRDRKDRVMGSFTWLSEDTQETTLRLTETPFCFTLKNQFAGDQLSMEIRPQVSFGGEEPVVIAGHRTDSSPLHLGK